MIEIVYTARRRLKSGITAGDIITLNMPCEQFSPSIEVSESTNTAIGGLPQVSLHHYFDKWSIKSLYDDVNDQEDYEQFLYSVLGGAQFTITDYDHNDEVKTVIMQGAFQKDPIRRFNAGEFNYMFNVRGVANL